MENRNLQWNKRVKVPLILIFSVNTNHESVAYRSFSPSEFEARGARKVTTGIRTSLNDYSPRLRDQRTPSRPAAIANRERVVRSLRGRQDVRRHSWMRGTLVR